MENMATVMMELQAQADILMHLDDEVCEIVSSCSNVGKLRYI